MAVSATSNEALIIMGRFPVSNSRSKIHLCRLGPVFILCRSQPFFPFTGILPHSIVQHAVVVDNTFRS